MHAGLTQLADIFVSDPASHFTRGQSIRAHITSTDAATGRMSLNLRPSVTTAASAEDGSLFLGSYFADLEAAESLRCKLILCWRFGNCSGAKQNSGGERGLLHCKWQLLGTLSPQISNLLACWLVSELAQFYFFFLWPNSNPCFYK